MPALDDAARTRFTQSNPDWALDGETIRRTFAFADFKEAMAFVTQVALFSEVADHHPDIDIRWNKVSIALTTHDAGALTSKDTSLAEAISARS